MSLSRFCTLHPTPYNLHPTPYTLHPTPYTLHPKPYALHPTNYPPPEFRNLKSLNPNPETQNLRPDTRCPNPETRIVIFALVGADPRLAVLFADCVRLPRDWLVC